MAVAAAVADSAAGASGEAAAAGAGAAASPTARSGRPLLSEADMALVCTRAATLHNVWRAPRLLPDGTYKPRPTRGAGGQMEDVANTNFDQLSEANQQPCVPCRPRVVVVVVV